MRDTERILESKGYNYYSWEEPGEEPEYSNVSFKDIIPGLDALEIGPMKLYKHQHEALESLEKGYNIILVSGTGSGKTEAWVLYALRRTGEQDFHALAVYPTIALANDQIRRINKYSQLTGIGSLQLDATRRSMLASSIGVGRLRERIASSKIIVTNPAYLMHEVKKTTVSPSKSLLHLYFQKLSLLVIDELDFYGPRSLSLLLGIIKILASLTDQKLQVAVLTAALSNPEDLGVYLREATGRDYRVITGRAFHVRNKTIIVLGKDLRGLWEKILPMLRKEASRLQDPELMEIVRDPMKHADKIYRVLALLEAMGYDVPSPTLDPVEILSEYIGEEGVTLVFTRSIAAAEELARRLKAIVGEEQVATHHHLVSKKYREEVEEKARRGELNIIVNPKTLSQGIDIGTIIRIVHLGLPEDVREYYQREGRKGRRRGLEKTETLIIPYTRWDRELLMRGMDAFRKWIGMGIEKTIINPENLYQHLFTGVLKLKSPWLSKELGVLEEKALRKTGVLKGDTVDERLLDKIYTNLNFYEYAPPYGIKRYLRDERGERPLEPIGHCDLVEKFQPGCIDYSEDSIVTYLKTGKTSRIVTAVYEKPISWDLFRSDDAFQEVREEYRYIKMMWNDNPNIVGDLRRGIITSDEICVVYTPSDGFGRYLKIPDRCIWTVRSRRPRLIVKEGKTIVYYAKKPIVVPKQGAGEYRDYTYGYRYNVDPGEDMSLARLALAYLMIVLRRELGIPFETIMYDTVMIGEDKYFKLHEPESAGLIEKLDWKHVRTLVEKHVPDGLDELLLSMLDDISYSTLLSLGYSWKTVAEAAARIVDYILLREKIKVILAGRKIEIPRPSPGLKLVSVKILYDETEDPKTVPHRIVGIAYYDGINKESAVEVYPAIPSVKPPETLTGIERKLLNKIVYEGFKLILYDPVKFAETMGRAGLKMLQLIPRESMVSIKSLAEASGINPFSPGILLETMGLYEETDPAIAQEHLSKLKLNPRSRYSAGRIGGFLENEAVKNYILYLALKTLNAKP